MILLIPAKLQLEVILFAAATGLGQSWATLLSQFGSMSSYTTADVCSRQLLSHNMGRVPHWGVVSRLLQWSSGGNSNDYHILLCHGIQRTRILVTFGS
jgi:hypothetical protein